MSAEQESQRASAVPPQDREPQFDAPCGLYCGACDVFLATQRGEQEALAKMWGRSVSEITCRGCRSPQRAAFCTDCGIRDCVRRRAIAHCGLCPRFPCEQLVEFRDSAAHHAAVLRNLRRLKAAGSERWLQEQQERWRCPACGRASGWYDTQCDRCGTPLVSCQEEDLSPGLE